jgi:cell division protein FtsI (penicillin-binding protein 3)
VIRGPAGVSRAVKIRAYAATVVMTGLFAGVCYAAWELQVEAADEFRQRAIRQHVHSVEIPAPRGAIVDARGRAMAVTAAADSIWANPREVVDVAGTAERLAAMLELDAALLEARLSSDRAFVWIDRHVTPEQAAAVRGAGLRGVELTTEPRRWYPGRESGGPVIGFAGIDGNGLDGVELRFDAALTGERARFAALRDARGKTALAEGMVDAVPGATVQLTIDRAIQAAVDRALADAVAAHDARSGVAIVLDVETGGILAMASWPTYDPNEPGDAVARQARNRAVTDVYEIGSIMKVFTVAAAFDAKLTRPDETWNVEHGRWQLGKKTIRDTHRDETLTTAGILKRSSNVGVVKLALRIGRERLAEALRRYGFGARTGIELPLEERGTLRDGKRWREIELATISFGYGLAVTPLQVAAAMAALGDDGRWHTPHLIARITDADGDVVYQPEVETRQIFDERTARWMLPILESVFEPGRKTSGTAATVVVDGFRAGGKTATAHKIDPRTRRYAEKMYLSSFAGLAPIDDPKISVVVVIDEPRGKDYFGGKVAGPVFARIVSETLRYLGVPGSTPVNAPKPGELRPEAEPEPDVVVPIDAELELGDLPDFRGMSVEGVSGPACHVGVVVEVAGSGRAIEQSVRGDGTVRVVFAEPGGARRGPPDLATGMEIGESPRSLHR